MPHFVYPFSVDGHLDYFHLGVIMNNDAMIIYVQVLAQTHVFSSLEYTWE